VLLALAFLLVTFAPALGLVALARRRLITWVAAGIGLIAQAAVLAWMVSGILGSSSSTAAIGFLAVPPVLFVVAAATAIVDLAVGLVRRLARPPA
jgi:hypothetical protein